MSPQGRNQKLTFSASFASRAHACDQSDPIRFYSGKGAQEVSTMKPLPATVMVDIQLEIQRADMPVTKRGGNRHNRNSPVWGPAV